MTEVLGRQIDRHGRTSMLPGMGAGPTMNVAAGAPRSSAPAPASPQHIRRRRARFALAIVLLLAVTIGAIGWWLGSGRWTDVPELIGQEQSAAIDLLQGAGLDPDCCEEQWSETVPRRARSCPPTRPAGDAIRGTDVAARRLARARSASGSTPRWWTSRGRRRAAAAGSPCRRSR